MELQKRKEAVDTMGKNTEVKKVRLAMLKQFKKSRIRDNYQANKNTLYLVLNHYYFNRL